MSFVASQASSSAFAADTKDGCAATTAPARAFFPPPPYARKPQKGSFWYGTDALWTGLPAQGEWKGLSHDAKGFHNKLFWYRRGYDLRSERDPALTVTGRRLDGDAPPLSASPASGVAIATDVPAMLIGVTFPTEGCWEVTGRYGKDALTFVVSVAP